MADTEHKNADPGLLTELMGALAHARSGHIGLAHKAILAALGMVCSFGARKVQGSLWANKDGRVALCFDNHHAPVADHFPGHHEPSQGVGCSCGWMNLGIVDLMAGPYLFMGLPSCAQRHPEKIVENMIIWQGWRGEVHDDSHSPGFQDKGEVTKKPTSFSPSKTGAIPEAPEEFQRVIRVLLNQLGAQVDYSPPVLALQAAILVAASLASGDARAALVNLRELAHRIDECCVSCPPPSPRSVEHSCGKCAACLSCWPMDKKTDQGE